MYGVPRSSKNYPPDRELVDKKPNKLHAIYTHGETLLFRPIYFVTRNKNPILSSQL